MFLEFVHALQQRKWTVDTNLDHDHLHDVLPSSKPSTEAASQVHRDSGEGEAEEDGSDGGSKSKGPAPFPGNISPRTLWDLRRALIVKTSHIGGHKYTGNVIVSEFAPFALANTDQAPSTLAPTWIAVLNDLRTYTPPSLTSQRLHQWSCQNPISRIPHLLSGSVFGLRSVSTAPTFVISSTSYLLSVKSGPKSDKRLIVLSLDLYSCGAVDLVRSRHCPRGRQHRRTDHRPGKDHTLAPQSRHERFQARLPFPARLVTDPRSSRGSQSRPWSNTLSQPAQTWALLSIAAAYLKGPRPYSCLCTLR